MPIKPAAHCLLHEFLPKRLRLRTLAVAPGQWCPKSEGMPLHMAFESHQPHSCILRRLPDTGKTVIAQLMAEALDARLIPISAVPGDTKDIRNAMDLAEKTRSSFTPQISVVVADEMHRFNKAVKPNIKQQRARLMGKIPVHPHCSVRVGHG